MEITLPPNLVSALGSEKKEFVVKAGRAQPLKNSLYLLIFGIAWTAFSSIFVAAFLGPLFLGKEVRFESNGVPTVASLDNLGPIILPAIAIGIFVLFGLGMIFWSIYSTFRAGGYYVGTPTRLVHYRNGEIRFIDWENFSGDISVSGDSQNGDISLQLRTGKMVNRKHGSEYVPDFIYISKIPDAFEIEKICRQRIKENDPTPATKT